MIGWRCCKSKPGTLQYIQHPQTLRYQGPRPAPAILTGWSPGCPPRHLNCTVTQCSLHLRHPDSTQTSQSNRGGDFWLLAKVQCVYLIACLLFKYYRETMFLIVDFYTIHPEKITTTLKQRVIAKFQLDFLWQKDSCSWVPTYQA